MTTVDEFITKIREATADMGFDERHDYLRLLEEAVREERWDIDEQDTERTTQRPG